MHPAFSVIVFTVISGAGYGLLTLIGLGALLGWLPPERGFALAAFGLAFALTTGQVLSWNGQGHTAYLKSKCIDNAVDTYLISGTLPDVGTVCPD